MIALQRRRMDFIESLSFSFYCTDLPTACMPARADAIYVVFSDEKMKVCKLFLLLAVGNYLSLRCIRGLEILWRPEHFRTLRKVVFSSLLPATHQGWTTFSDCYYLVTRFS